MNICVSIFACSCLSNAQQTTDKCIMQTQHILWSAGLFKLYTSKKLLQIMQVCFATGSNSPTHCKCTFDIPLLTLVRKSGWDTLRDSDPHSTFKKTKHSPKNHPTPLKEESVDSSRNEWAALTYTMTIYRIWHSMHTRHNGYYSALHAGRISASTLISWELMSAKLISKLFPVVDQKLPKATWIK